MSAWQLLIPRTSYVFRHLRTVDLRYLLSSSCNSANNSSSQQIINLKNENLQKYLEALRREFYDLRVNTSGGGASIARLKQLDGVVTALEKHRSILGNMTSIEEIEKEEDEDMRKLIQEENELYTKLLQQTEEELYEQLLSLADDERYPSLIFEINAGAGGQEAMLFAQELFDMYINYFDHNDWPYEVLAQDNTDIGGLRHANLIVEGPLAYNTLRYEAGVHRVQRIPATEKSSRIHTSTASIAVIPRPAGVTVTIAEKDLKIETKRASGAGGQHVNTTDSAVRVVHLPTGIAVECQSERSQLKNREIAIKRLQAKLIQQQLEKDESSQKATRKAQQGNLERNEKIRTYNFEQDRVTDHRIPGGTVHNLERVLEGGSELHNFIDRVITVYRREKMAALINSHQGFETKTNDATVNTKKIK